MRTFCVVEARNFVNIINYQKFFIRKKIFYAMQIKKLLSLITEK